MICVMSVTTGMGQIISVPSQPEVFPFNWVSKITTNTVILTKPWCFFSNVSCTPDCEVWVVPAVNTGMSNFDADKSASNIISLSPYPTAFSTITSKNYFLTKVGLYSDFPCSPITGPSYFVVGSDGNCSTKNCNGVLPVGSTVRFKYLLLSPINETVLAESQWSNNVTLYSVNNTGALNVTFAGRSPPMVVITTLVCVATGLLLLLLLAAIIYVCCCKRDRRKTVQVSDSLRVRKYDTHNLKESSPYSNQAYEHDSGRFASAEQKQYGDVQHHTKPIKLKSYTDYDLPVTKPATQL